MRGKRVLRHAEALGEVTGGNAIGFCLHECAEGLKAGRLSKGCKGSDGF